VKNLSQTLKSIPQHTDLVKNFQEMIDEILVIGHRTSKIEGVTASGLFVMHCITSKGPQRLTDFSVSLGVSKPTVTKIVDNLEKNGFVKRIKKGNDRRTYYVHITEFGKRRLATMNRTIQDALYNVTEQLSPEEIRLLNSFISSIRDKLKSISN